MCSAWSCVTVSQEKECYLELQDGLPEPFRPHSRLQVRKGGPGPLSLGVGSPEHCSWQEMSVPLSTQEGSFLGRGSRRSPGGTLSKAYLEDGVVSILAGTVPCGMAPGDIEEFLFPIDPLKPWVLAAVHLGHQPGLQPHTARWWGNPWG